MRDVLEKGSRNHGVVTVADLRLAGASDWAVRRMVGDGILIRVLPGVFRLGGAPRTWEQRDHGNGLTTRYGHLASFLVSPGEKVQAGQVIGLTGSTGRSTGPHLHYETRIAGEAVNPVRFLEAGKLLRRMDG